MLSVCEEKRVRICTWSPWFDDELAEQDSRGLGKRRFSRGILFSREEEEYEEVELLADARLHPKFPENCEVPSDIHCRTVDTHVFANQTGDDVTCEAETGLICREQKRRDDCHDYEVRFLCCSEEYTVTCETTPGIHIISDPFPQYHCFNI